MTGIEEGISQIKYPVLLTPKPNPFTNRTEIKFQIPTKTKVELKIYNSIGKAVNTLIAEEMEPGYYTITWNGKDQYQRTQSNDIYFIRLKTKDYAAIRKLILIR
jgi:flagellar hook assembly protein FlgD